MNNLSSTPAPSGNYAVGDSGGSLSVGMPLDRARKLARERAITGHTATVYELRPITVFKPSVVEEPLHDDAGV